MLLKYILNSIDIKKIDGKENIDIKSITLDSREIEKNSLYIAIKGFNVDGHKFIKSAIEKGAKAIVYHDENYNLFKKYKNVTFIRVKDINKTQAILANNFYNNPSHKMKIIAITGTNGKTSTSYIIDSILNSQNINSGVIGTIGYKINNITTKLENTTPDAITLAKIMKKMYDSGVEIVIMEVSSHALVLDRVWGIDFDIFIWTNLTQDHLDFHNNMEEYYQAKKLLFTKYYNKSIKKDKKIIINFDDFYAKRLYKELKDSNENISLIGLKEKIAIKDVNFFNIEDYKLTLKGIKFSINYKNKKFNFSSSLVGEYNIYNSITAIISSYYLNIEFKDLEISFNKVKQIPGRLENCNIENKAIFIDYAHTPDAVESVLKTIKALTKKKLYALIGAGGDRDKTKRKYMSIAASKFCNKLIISSDNPRTEDPEKILDDLEKPIKNKNINYIRITNRKEAIIYVLNKITQDDCFIICGKGHEDYQIIGKEKIYFSDIEVVKNYYLNKG